MSEYRTPKIRTHRHSDFRQLVRILIWTWYARIIFKAIAQVALAMFLLWGVRISDSCLKSEQLLSKLRAPLSEYQTSSVFRYSMYNNYWQGLNKKGNFISQQPSNLNLSCFVFNLSIEIVGNLELARGFRFTRKKNRHGFWASTDVSWTIYKKNIFIKVCTVEW